MCYSAAMTGRYDHLSKDDLVRLLERRDTMQRYGLVWEREGIEKDRALNQDYVVLDLDPALSTPPQDAAGWRNLVIEGDNWDTLRALRLTHGGRVRCILIDPPYNTGNKDFAYNDSFVGKDDRFRHSTWLEFLYQRLVLARDLLADDGVILVCINDENRARLDLLMERVFPGMRIGSFVWRTKDTNNADKKRNYSGVHEHVLIYANQNFGFLGDKVGSGKFRVNPTLGDTPVRLDPITQPQSHIARPNCYYPIFNPFTQLWYPCAPNQVWRFWSETKPPKGKARLEKSMEMLINAGEIYFPPEEDEPFLFKSVEDINRAILEGQVPRDGRGRPLLRADLPDLSFWVGKPIARGRLSRIVRWTSDMDDNTRPVGSWIAGLNEDSVSSEVDFLKSDRQGAATTMLEHIFGEKVFHFPKPLSLVRALIRACCGDGDTVIDFFAGSGTTAHAVLMQNSEDDADRHFIMVSSTESTADQPDKNLCRDVCAERIRRVIDGYGDEPGLGGDFAYLRTRRIAEEDVMYDFDPPALWTLLQLRQGHPLRAFDPDAPYQLSRPLAETEDRTTLVFAPHPTPDAIAALQTITGAIQIFTPIPGPLREALTRPGVTVEVVPDRLLSEFRRTVAGI